MTRRASDMPPEERAAYEARLAETLQRCNEADARLAERAERRAADGSDLEDAAQEREHQQAARQQGAAAAAQRRMEQLIDQRVAAALAQYHAKQDKMLSKLMYLLGAEVCKWNKDVRAKSRAELAEARTALEDRATRNEAATVELLRELETRIGKLEPAPVAQGRDTQRPVLAIGYRSAAMKSESAE